MQSDHCQIASLAECASESVALLTQPELRGVLAECASESVALLVVYVALAQCSHLYNGYNVYHVNTACTVYIVQLLKASLHSQEVLNRAHDAKIRQADSIVFRAFLILPIMGINMK